MPILGLPLIVIYIIFDIGNVGSRWLPQWFLRPGAAIVQARKATLLLCALGALPVLLISHTSHLCTVIGILGIATAAHQGWSANLYTAASAFPSLPDGCCNGRINTHLSLQSPPLPISRLCW